jgi:hypothetical protein
VPLDGGGAPRTLSGPSPDPGRPLVPIFTKRIGPQLGHTRWQLGRGGPARRSDRTPSRSSSMITAAPILIFFTTNYMGTGTLPHRRRVRSMAASSARGVRSQRDIPQLCRGPLRGLTQSACTTTLRVDPRQRFPQSVGVGCWPRKSAGPGWAVTTCCFPSGACRS